MESFTYDDDGNLTQVCGTGVSPVNYTWDAENRLTCAQSGDPNSPASGDKKVEFVYDFLGRRVEKKVSTHNGTSWSVSDCRRFVWSDWLLVLDLEGGAGVPPANTILRKHTWGLDLAGQSGGSASGRSIDSAGGIGGLLATEDVARLGAQQAVVASRPLAAEAVC